VIALREAECCALVGTGCRPLLLRRRASRPQLKRDSLGSRTPIHPNELCYLSTLLPACLEEREPFGGGGALGAAKSSLGAQGFESPSLRGLVSFDGWVDRLRV